MTRPGPFNDRMKALVERIAVEGRAATESMVESIVDAGVTSDGELVELVRDRAKPVELRTTACWLLARSGIDGAADALLDVLADPASDVREEAASGLSFVGDVDSVPALVAACRDVEIPVRRAAIHALGMLADASSTPTLFSLMSDLGEDEMVRADAAEACAHIDDAAIVDALLDVLDDASPYVRYSAAFALGQQADPKAIGALTKLAAADDAMTSWGSVESAARAALDAIARRDT